MHSLPEVALSVYTESLHDDSEASNHWFHHTELESGLRRKKTKRSIERGDSEKTPYLQKAMYTLDKETKNKEGMVQRKHNLPVCRNEGI